MSTAEDGNMKKCVAVSLERLPCAQDRECILSACAHLAARAEDPMEIIALSSMAHALLTEANVKHVSFHLHPPAHYDEASFAKKLTMVVGNLPETWEQSASSFAPAFYHSVASRGLLFSKVTCILVEGYYPLLFQAGAVPESKSKWVNARSLEYLAAHSQRMADSILIHSHLGPKPQRVMVVGGGGREHAIAWKLSQSSHVREVLVLPGNGGTAGMPKIRNLAGNISDLANVVKLAQTNEVDFAVVGPEQPLVDGLTDRLAEVGIPCFGPSARAARLEGSKAFSKDFMQRHGIPTARFRNFTDLDLAVAHLESIDYPVVIKASGLAAGKGVVLPETAEEGVAELRAMMAEKRFGAAGEEVVIEERLFGEEISVMAFCDGRKAVLMPAAQDHKRIFDGDRGPNTGGMGTIAPAPIFSSPRLREQVFHAIDTTLAAARREGFPFVGVLFTGFMVTEEGAKVLEYNCRFGDPETQSVLPLLKSDLFEVMRSCVLGDVGSGVAVAWEDALAACAVMTASEGYPGKYEKGREIVGLDKVVGRGDQVFHSGTKEVDGKVITSGGRVLAVSAVRQTLQEALNAAYEVVRHVVKFDGMQFRSDIGAKSLRPPLKLGVLGSTRGTDLQYIIDAISCGWVNAEVSGTCFS